MLGGSHGRLYKAPTKKERRKQQAKRREISDQVYWIINTLGHAIQSRWHVPVSGNDMKLDSEQFKVISNKTMRESEDYTRKDKLALDLSPLGHWGWMSKIEDMEKFKVCMYANMHD